MPASPFKRIVVLVLDGLGVGAMPDAAEFGDAGSDTLGHVAASRPLSIPRMQELGIGCITPLPAIPPARHPQGCFGKMTLASRGKDTTSGHWEMMGLVLETPFPTFPQGFPPRLIHAFERTIGRSVIGNRAASGTAIIQELGSRHLATGSPIVYTSADSVFQIAAHTDVLPLPELYRMCEIARAQLTGPDEVGRVIARPFSGLPGNFFRTPDRRDYAVPPFRRLVLDALDDARVPVVAIGKIASIFCNRGIRVELKTTGNSDTTLHTLSALASYPRGFVFVNYVDFDMLYGHRNDVEGYASALEAFDRDLPGIQAALDPEDLLLLVSDHGCDPTTPSTDHSREYALLLTASQQGAAGRDLGTRGSLADIGATIAENFGVASPAGTSFLSEVTGDG